MRLILKIFTVLLPWKLKRLFLCKWFEYEIDATAKIGLAWIFPQKLVMASGAKIGHFNVAVNLDKIILQEKATIGRGNWITGFSTLKETEHFVHEKNRESTLMVGKHSAITKNHHIDCTNLIKIGDFVTIAGYHSQFLTHSIDVYENRQCSKPIFIGDYAFIGTNTVVLGGAKLPDHCLLAAKSLLNKSHIENWKVYGGVPARIIADLPKDAKYFSRIIGFVN